MRRFNGRTQDPDSPKPLFDVIQRWPHQVRAVAAVLNAMDRGVRRILVVSPTGGGKSLIMADLCRVFLEREWGVSVFTNRKMLFEQLSRNLDDFGFDFGVRAAGHPGDMDQLLQLSSIQTEYARVVKRDRWAAHSCRAYLVDEAHLNENKTAQKVYGAYGKDGAVKIGFTATPLGLSDGYDELIEAGTISELQACGALVPARHFGCTEPDLRNVRKFAYEASGSLSGEDLTDEENRKLIMVPGIHGRVIDWFNKLNPHGLPSIGFAPGVPESVGFAEAFEEAGISAAHVDGDRIWIRGDEAPSTEERRRVLLELSESGKVRIVWNRFVLREAVDMPWLRHGVLATVYGSPQSFLQSGGRLLRACKGSGKESVTVQDHGGNWWRHGSLNRDRHWRLTDTNRILANEHKDSLTGEVGDDPKLPKEPEPFLCHRCQGVMRLRSVMNDDNISATCPHCGAVVSFRRRSRPVIQSTGELVEHQGTVFQPRRVERRHDTAEKWKRMYFRARASGMTFPQAAGLFLMENGYSPPRDMPFMPLKDYDWYLSASKVPFSKLRPEEK